MLRFENIIRQIMIRQIISKAIVLKVTFLLFNLLDESLPYFSDSQGLSGIQLVRSKDTIYFILLYGNEVYQTLRCKNLSLFRIDTKKDPELQIQIISLSIDFGFHFSKYLMLF